MENRLVLAGVIIREVKTRNTPAGIPISRFTIQHESQQTVAGMQRQAACRIEVVAAGAELSQKVRALGSGQTIRVSGFIARSRHHEGETRLVLHAQQIELIESVEHGQKEN